MDQKLQTSLKDRALWFDGDSTVSASELISLLEKGSSIEGLYVDVITPAIEQYNQFVEDKIEVKQNINEIKIDWVVPEQYKNIDIEYVISEAALDYCEENHCNEEQEKEVAKRVSTEMKLYKKYNLFPLLRVLFFIINTFQSNNVVWGVGRGSSVSSFVLYLIGVHDVDSMKYDLPIEDFLHD